MTLVPMSRALSGTLVPTMPVPLLDDPGDLSALRAKGGDADELFTSFAAWAGAQAVTGENVERSCQKLSPGRKAYSSELRASCFRSG